MKGQYGQTININFGDIWSYVT